MYDLSTALRARFRSLSARTENCRPPFGLGVSPGTRTCQELTTVCKAYSAVGSHRSHRLIQLPVTAIREIKILNELSHVSMVKLLEIVTSVGEVSCSPVALLAVSSEACRLKWDEFMRASRANCRGAASILAFSRHNFAKSTVNGTP